MGLTFVFTCGDVLIRSKFQDVLSLVGTSTYTNNTISPKCFGEENTVMAKSATISSLAISSPKRERTITHPTPTIPTLLPGPHPLFFNGLYIVIPPHNIGAASSPGKPSGILNTNGAGPR
jgi:hypothetical protein